MKRVLVTGGAGYLEAVLCGRLLALRTRVTVLDSFAHRVNSLLHLSNHLSSVSS